MILIILGVLLVASVITIAFLLKDKLSNHVVEVKNKEKENKKMEEGLGKNPKLELNDAVAELKVNRDFNAIKDEETRQELRLQEIQSLHDRVEVLEASRDSLLNQLSQHQTFEADLKQKLIQSQTSSESARILISKLEMADAEQLRMRADLEKSYQELKLEHSEMLEESNLLISRNKELESENNQLQTRLNDLMELHVAERLSRESDYSHQLEVIQNISNAEKKLLEKERESVQILYAEKLNSILKQTASTRDSERLELESRINSLQNMHMAAMQQKESQIAELCSMHEKNNLAKTMKHDLEKLEEKNKLNAVIDDLKKAMSSTATAHENELISLRKNLETTFTAEIDLLKQQVKELEVYKAESRNLKVSMESLLAENKRLDVLHENATKDLAAAIKKNSDLEAFYLIDRNESSVSGLKENFAVVRKQFAESVSLVESLTTSLENSKKENECLVASKEKQQEVLERMAEELRVIKITHSQLETTTQKEIKNTQRVLAADKLVSTLNHRKSVKSGASLNFSESESSLHSAEGDSSYANFHLLSPGGNSLSRVPTTPMPLANIPVPILPPATPISINLPVPSLPPTSSLKSLPVPSLPPVPSN